VSRSWFEVALEKELRLKGYVTKGNKLIVKPWRFAVSIDAAELADIGDAIDEVIYIGHGASNVAQLLPEEGTVLTPEDFANMMGQFPSVATTKLIGCDIIDTGFGRSLASGIKSKVYGGRGTSTITVHVSDFSTMQIDKVTITGRIERVRAGAKK